MVIKVRKGRKVRPAGRPTDRPRQNCKYRAARNDQFCVRRPPAAGNRVGNQILINHNEGKWRRGLGRPRRARGRARAAAFLTSLFIHSNVGGKDDN